MIQHGYTKYSTAYDMPAKLYFCHVKVLKIKPCYKMLKILPAILFNDFGLFNDLMIITCSLIFELPPLRKAES